MTSHKDFASGKIVVQRRNESLDGIYDKTTNFLGTGYILYGPIRVREIVYIEKKSFNHL